MQMLSNALKYVNVANEIELDMAWEFENCNFLIIFLNGLFQLFLEQNS